MAVFQYAGRRPLFRSGAHPCSAGLHRWEDHAPRETAATSPLVSRGGLGCSLVSLHMEPRDPTLIQCFDTQPILGQDNGITDLRQTIQAFKHISS